MERWEVRAIGRKLLLDPEPPALWASASSSSLSFLLRAQSVWRIMFCGSGRVESLQPLPPEAMGV